MNGVKSVLTQQVSANTSANTITDGTPPRTSTTQYRNSLDAQVPKAFNCIHGAATRQQAIDVNVTHG